jgi:hypothetical protein
MTSLWIGATALAACLLAGTLYASIRRRRRQVRRKERRRRNLAHALAWDLFMMPKRTRRIEYHPDGE